MHLNDQSRSSLLLIMLRLVRSYCRYPFPGTQCGYQIIKIQEYLFSCYEDTSKFVVVNTFAWKIKGHRFESRWGRKFSLVFCQIKNIWSYLLWRPLVAREHLEVVLIQTMDEFRMDLHLLSQPGRHEEPEHSEVSVLYYIFQRDQNSCQKSPGIMRNKCK